MTGDKSIKQWKNEYRMDEIISDTLDIVTVSESDRYVEFRNNLVTILDEFLEKKIDVNGEHAPELTAIRKRLCESQFEIALVGEFQGGKSTTFNMLCGGREISPRGLNGGGIKTSAAVVTAQNIDGEETKDGLSEWAEISWLDIDEIRRRIGSVLEVYDAEQPEQKKLHKKFEKTADADFESLLRAAWAKNPHNDELDQLRVATLQFRLLSDPKLQKYFSQKIVAIDSFQRFVMFPSNWEARWENKFDADFSTEECLFSVVDRVLARIHSQPLARLGCKITDCPGLFASQWDTDRAISVMRHANAIWYLLRGERQIGKSDMQALAQIKAFQWEDKCFFSINRRKSINSSIEILNSDISALKNHGFHPERIYMYDAFLAFRIAQMKLAKNGLSTYELKCLAEETARRCCSSEVLNELVSDSSKRENAIHKLVVKHLMAIDEMELGEALSSETSVSAKLLERLHCESGIGEILPAIEKWIITKRARSILVSEGSKQCLAVLDHLQAKLVNQELASEQTLADAQNKAEEASVKLEKFLYEWEKNFSFMKSDAPDDGLAMDFFQEYDKEIKSSIRIRGIEICQEEWHGKHWNSSDVNSVVETKIKKEFLNLIKAKLECYRNNITKKPKFQETLGSLFSARIAEMKKIWNELKAENTLFDSIETVSEDDCNAFHVEIFSQRLDGSIDTPWYSWELLKDFITLGLRRFFQSPDDRIEKFFLEKDPVGRAYDAFKGNVENEKQIAHALGATRRAYLKCLDNSFMKMKQRLDSNIDEREKAVKLSNEEREQIAKRAKEIRKTIVEPYTDKILAFQKEVYRLYAE